jgi:hypothetical protein
MAARSAVAVEASWSCDAEQLRVKVRAVFDPSRSTLVEHPASVANFSDAELLEHEQIHFDIAELFARKIRSHFWQTTAPCRPGGTTPFAAILDDYRTELSDEQARYDRQTAFGTDARAQREWTSKTRRAIAPGANLP